MESFEESIRTPLDLALLFAAAAPLIIFGFQIIAAGKKRSSAYGSVACLLQGQDFHYERSWLWFLLAAPFMYRLLALFNLVLTSEISLWESKKIWLLLLNLPPSLIGECSQALRFGEVSASRSSFRGHSSERLCFSLMTEGFVSLLIFLLLVDPEVAPPFLILNQLRSRVPWAFQRI